MTKDINLHVEHLTRVEGHGGILLNVKKGHIEKVQWNVTEAPRLFEAFIQGKPYNQIAQIVSRICGICSIGHTLASLKATESAMGIHITDQSKEIRKLAIHAENMQSHILHLGYLTAPDLFGVGSVFPRHTYLCTHEYARVPIRHHGAVGGHSHPDHPDLIACATHWWTE